MYKYKVLNKSAGTWDIHDLHKYGVSLLGKCDKTGHYIHKCVDAEGSIVYAVLTPEKYKTPDSISVKLYDSIALYYRMFESTKTWDEVQIRDDVGRLCVLTKEAYKRLKNK